MKKHKRPLFYRLVGDKAVPCAGGWSEGLEDFAEELQRERHVAFASDEGWGLSTVFLGLDHNHFAMAMNASPEEAPPLLFETALFRRDEGAEILGRYSTWAEAEAGHNRVLSEILGKNLTLPKDTAP